MIVESGFDNLRRLIFCYPLPHSNTMKAPGLLSHIH